MLLQSLRAWVRRRKRLVDNNEELSFHLAIETEENIARGMSPAAAHDAARKKLGNLTLIRENVNDMSTLVWLQLLGKDVRYALRFMLHNRGFTLAAILTLALGIGGNTAIFSMIEAVLLKPLPYAQPDRLVYLAVNHPQQNLFDARLDPDRLKHLQGTKSFAALGAFGGNGENVTLSGEGRPEPLQGARVSANFLTVLGLRPVVGRSFLPEEDVANGPPVVLISYELWSRRFGRNPSIGGKIVRIDGKGYTIVGVLPPQFEFPFADLDIWFTRPSEWSALPSRYWHLALIQGFGRLKPNVSLEQAQAELKTLDENYGKETHAVHPGTVHLTTLEERLVRNIRSIFWLLSAAVAVVLLIACANVAGLLLARSAVRSREFAVRTAIGASRADLVRQLLVESMALALIGGLLGVPLALGALRGVSNAQSLNLYGPGALALPGASHLQLDSGVLLFTAVLCIISGVLCGLVPALQLARPNLVDALRQTGVAVRSSVPGFGRRLGIDARNVLVVGQIAFSLVLLIAAALLMRSVLNLQGTNPGFNPDHLLTSKLSLSPTKYDNDEKKAAFYRNLVDRIASTAGVESATVAMSLPTTTWIKTNITSIEGRPAPDENQPLLAVIQSVTADYFRTLKVSIRLGRGFEQPDDTQHASPVVVINEALARQLWPDYEHGFNPIGLRIKEGYDKAVGSLRVVGVIADVQESGLGGTVTPEFYIPTALHPPQSAYLVVRTESEPLAMAGTVRSRVESVDGDQSISDVRTMNAVLQNTLEQRKIVLLLLNVFAAAAFLLTVIGIYGTISYSVSDRTQELGIRRALGAQSNQILRMILLQGLGLSLSGLLIGIAAALALTRVMKSLLFGVSATDPLVFLSVATAFLLVALLSSYLPARHATQIDPMRALRTE